MATVYLARDLKHDRRVALKLLNPELGAVLGAERFLSEIRVTANLQHPNLLPLFDSGSAEGLLYYVMPYVEGETLRQRLDRERQLPVDEAVRLAVAIAGALNYAHERGVIHRDLKPENILLQQGQPVVADFGIALAVSNAGGERVTQTGLSLGTPQYMSPEQATGDRIIDARADVYSLGAVTYEMLAGDPPHTGTTAQAIIARLMTEEPRPLTIVRPSVPEHVDEAVRCALEKLPADRFATAGEFADALRGGSRSGRTRQTRAARATRDPRRRTLVASLVVVSAAAIVLAALLARSASRPEQPTTRFVVDLPPGQYVPTPEGSAVTMSPDGRMIAYLAATHGAGSQRIFVRSLDSLRARPIAGTEGANTPRFSPDGRWLAFKTGTDIRKVPLSGGSPEIVVAVADWQNFAWNSRGDVIVAQRGSLWRVDENGKLKLFTTPDTARGEVGQAGPWFLDDETIAFWAQKPTPDGTIRGVGLTKMPGGSYSILDIPGDMAEGYVAGHLLVSNQSGSLLAYPVDLGKRRVTGPPTEVVDSVVWIAPGGQQVNVSPSGSLVYLRGSSGKRLAVVDSRGTTVAQTPELRDYVLAAISADGLRVAVSIYRSQVGGRNPAFTDLWIWDLESRGLAQFTTAGGTMPDWSADGKRIAFLRSNANEFAQTAAWTQWDAWWAPVDRSAPEQRINFSLSNKISAVRFTPTGHSVVICAQDSVTSDDIYLVNLDTPNAPPVALAHTRFREFEPPGVAGWSVAFLYTSDELGRAEVYVRPLAPAEARE